MLKKKFDFIVVIVGLILLVIFSTGNVQACLCPPISVKERVKIMKKESDVIFTGTVKSVEKITATSYKVILSVKNSWKEKNIEEYTIYTGGGCEVSFIEGESYLVYAKKDENDHLATEICWGTGKIALANKDLKFLGKPLFTKAD